jgi:hypothetical protein
MPSLIPSSPASTGPNKRARFTADDHLVVAIEPDDTTVKVVLAELAEDDQLFAKELVGQKYFSTFSAARSVADEDESGLVQADEWGAQLEACEIDPDLLPPAKKQRAIDTFGDGVTVLDAPDLVLIMHFKHGKSHQVECRLPTDVPHPNPKFAGEQQYMKQFVSKEEAPSSPSDRKMVSIMIDTGKGGKQQHWVPAACL